MTTVHLVRHGQSTWNLSGRLQGASDTATLTRLGRAQASEAADVLADVLDVAPDGAAVGASPTMLRVSPLRRAWETAAIIGRRLAVTPIADDRLVEQHLGELEGMVTYDAFHAVGHLDWTDPASRPPGGESLHEVATRLRPLLATTRSGQWGPQVVLVTHGDCLRVLACLLRGDRLTRIDATCPPNGSVTTVVLERANGSPPAVDPSPPRP